MGDGLAEKMYVAWRAALADPTSVPSWGNIDTDGRRAFEAAARVARAEVTERNANTLGNLVVGELYGDERAVGVAFAAQRLRGKA